MSPAGTQGLPVCSEKKEGNGLVGKPLVESLEMGLNTQTSLRFDSSKFRHRNHSSFSAILFAGLLVGREVRHRQKCRKNLEREGVYLSFKS